MARNFSITRSPQNRYFLLQSASCSSACLNIPYCRTPSHHMKGKKQSGGAGPTRRKEKGGHDGGRSEIQRRLTTSNLSFVPRKS
jgi:hypothetical protein